MTDGTLESDPACSTGVAVSGMLQPQPRKEIKEMSSTLSRQFCAICAWRENCAKKFCVADGGARCPDFCRDLTLKDPEETARDQGPTE